jgi:hypothetical protein
MSQLLTAIRSRWLPLLGPPLVLAVLALKPATTGPTICPFAMTTGHACPLCGGTRAASALVRGDIQSAWALHPMVFVVVPLALFGWIAWLGVSKGWWAPPSNRLTNRFALVVGIAFFGVWLVRAFTGTLPPV